MELNTIEWNGIDFHEMEMRNIELNRMEGNCIKWNSFIHLENLYSAPHEIYSEALPHVQPR